MRREILSMLLSMLLVPTDSMMILKTLVVKRVWGHFSIISNDMK